MNDTCQASLRSALPLYTRGFAQKATFDVPYIRPMLDGRRYHKDQNLIGKIENSKPFGGQHIAEIGFTKKEYIPRTRMETFNGLLSDAVGFCKFALTVFKYVYTICAP